MGPPHGDPRFARGPLRHQPRPGPRFEPRQRHPGPPPDPRAERPAPGPEGPGGLAQLRFGVLLEGRASGQLELFSCGRPQGTRCSNPFESVFAVGSTRGCQECDIVVHVQDDGARVLAARSGRVLKRYRAGMSAAEVGLRVFEDFAPGSPLYGQAQGDAGGGGGLDAAEVEKIVQKAVREASKPAAAATAEAAPSSDADQPSYRFKENPDNIAIVVGVEKYADLPEATFAERDATAVRDHLLAMGYSSRNVVLLTGVRASRAGLAKTLETWLPNHAGPRSKVLFYYSGHGAPDPRSGDAYLVPADGDPQYLKDTAYPLARLYQRLGKLQASQVLVVLDACFSGTGGRSVLAKGTRPLVSRVAVDKALPEKVRLLTASAGDQVSGTDDEQGHGLMTYHLLKALNESKGRATLQEAYARLKTRVEDSARRANREQTPQLVPESAGPVSLR